MGFVLAFTDFSNPVVQPKVIFVDAVGTLFGVRDSVGQIYWEIAHPFGVTASPEALNKAFFQAFKAAEPMAFPDSDPTAVPTLEYRWWYTLAQKTFGTTDSLREIDDFDAFFSQLYAHFSTADPWVVYPETVDSLKRWQAKGIELGVLSNFDSRLYTVLEVLGLSGFFQSITISSEVGAAKPDPQIFAAALQKHQCPATAAWHVGDSYQDDYEGARAAGLTGIWLNRPTA